MDDDLTAAYFMGFHAAQAEMRELRAQNAELLKALKQIADRAVPVQKEEHRMARAAIAKARGEL
jgi:hypothetical protein